MSRPCDAFRCGATVTTGRFLCSKHWRLVPTTVQRTINERYRAGRSDFAFLSDLIYLQACIDAINHLAKGDGHNQGDVIGDSSSYGRLLRAAKARTKGIDAIELPEQDSAFLLGEVFRHPDYVDTQPPYELQPMELVQTEVERVRKVLGPRNGGAR